MAFRVRFVHLILLGLVAMSLVIYSSYYATSPPPLPPPPQPQPPPPPQPPPLPTPDGKAAALGANSLSGASKSFGAPPEVASANLVQQPAWNNGSNIPPDREEPAMVAVLKVNVSTSSPSSLSTSAVAAVVAVEKSGAVFHIQHIPVAASKLAGAAAAGAGDSTEKGIATRSIYQAGYTIANAGLCPHAGNATQLVILITSAPGHTAARMAIRHTWGHFGQRSDLSIAFFLGTTNDQAVRKEIDKEATLYNDIVYANFLDSYNNLTLKTVSMLEWVDSYCNQTRFFLKTDDDMFINVPVLLNFIEKHSKFQKVIFGRLAKKWKPIRIKKSKYYVSPEQYKPVLFPNFTTGPAYLMTGDAVKDLYRAALEKTYLKLEDVFITGIVAQEVKIKRVHVNEFFNKRMTFNACNIQKGISIHMIKFYEQFDLWKRLLDGRSKCP